MGSEVLIPVAAAVVAGSLSPALTLWFTRTSRRAGLVNQQAETIESYWKRIQDQEMEINGLKRQLAAAELKIQRLEAQVYRLLQGHASG